MSKSSRNVFRAVPTVALAIAALTSNAAAQSGGQTKESAQRFLAQVFPRNINFVVVQDGLVTRSNRSGELRADDNHCLTIIPIASASNGTEDFRLNWADVVEVTHAEGSTGASARLKGGLAVQVELGAAALAVRTAFAMEFLRQACDRTADTGF